MRTPALRSTAATALLWLITAGTALAHQPEAAFIGPPGAPEVTAGAGAKVLFFDWNRVPGATHYRVLGDIDGDTDGDGLPEREQIGRTLPAKRTSVTLAIPTHRVRWTEASYVVAACNASGCSESPPILVQDLMLDSIAYFKAFNTEAGDRFGSVVALSGDGGTLAVAAPGEDGGGTGVNPRAGGDAIDSGAVYVFRRASGQWIRSAYLKASVAQAGATSGGGNTNERRTLSVSREGTFIAVGAPSFDAPSGVTDAGAVHVYQRAKHRWKLQATLQLPDARRDDRFGYEVDLSANARMLAVRSQRTTSEGGYGETYVYSRDRSHWQLTAVLPPPARNHVCLSGRLSGDGRTLVLGCGVPDQDRLLFQLVTLKRNGSHWLHAATTAVDDAQGWNEQPFALDHSGTAIAMRVVHQDIWPVEAVRVLVWDGAAWVTETNILDDPFSATSTFARGLAFSGNGNLLAIGVFSSTIDGAGVLPESFMGTSPDGAVLLYSRAGEYPTLRWIKAPNPDAGDSFGRSLALDHSGNTLAIGSSGEASRARGVDGDQADDSAPEAGAAYLY